MVLYTLREVGLSAMGKQEMGPAFPLKHHNSPRRFNHNSPRRFNAAMDEKHCMSACLSAGACQKTGSAARVQRRRKRCLVRSSSWLKELGCVRSLKEGIFECPVPRIITPVTIQQPEPGAQDGKKVCSTTSNGSGSLPLSAVQAPGKELGKRPGGVLVTPGSKRPTIEFTSIGGGPRGHAPWMQVYASGSQNRHHGQPVYISQDECFVLYYWDMGAERGWWLGRKQDGVAAENMLAYLPPGDELWWAFQNGKPCRTPIALSEPAEAPQEKENMPLREGARAGGAEEICFDAATDSASDHCCDAGPNFQRILDTKEKGEPLGAIVLQRCHRAAHPTLSQSSTSGAAQTSRASSSTAHDATKLATHAVVGGVRPPAAKKLRKCGSQSNNLLLAAHGVPGMSSFLDAKSAARQDRLLQQLAQEGVLVEDNKAVFARLAQAAIRGAIGGMPAAPPRPALSRSIGLIGVARERLLRI